MKDKEEQSEDKDGINLKWVFQAHGIILLDSLEAFNCQFLLGSKINFFGQPHPMPSSKTSKLMVAFVSH